MNLKHNNPIAAFKKGWDEFREDTTTHYGAFLILLYEECHNAGEIPVSFRVWFETAYYYDMRDLMPTGEIFTGFRSLVPFISLN